MRNNTDNNSAYLGLNIPITGVGINNTGNMLNQRVKYDVKTGMAIISTANPYLDGSGTVSSIITGGSNGTIIKKITIKAESTTQQGMIRIFLKASSSYWLLQEVEVPIVTCSGQDKTFCATLDELFYLKPSYSLYASTEKGDSFVVMAEGLETSYPA